ncbi:MAG: ATP-binding cassette domain-containing protein [Actinobacteria bacterium]|nr:ATP-binding cassette domain-containing protein [Actinomycetota bacterium]
MTPVLTVDQLELRFGGVTALAGVSFTVDAGERVALVGPNGAGKTSILNCISGVERPSAGRILFRGDDLARKRPAARAAAGVARTLQALAVVDSLDVMANLLLGRHRLSRAGVAGAALRLPRARREEAAHRERCRELAGTLGLADDLGTLARDLPPGRRKRVELGRALAMDPVLLLLDEPFAGAGPEDIAVMAGAVRGVSDRGVAVVVVDHDLATVLGPSGPLSGELGPSGPLSGELGRGTDGARSGGLAQRAVVLDAGRVVQS